LDLGHVGSIGMEELGGNPQRVGDGGDWLHLFLVYELHGYDPLPLLDGLQAGSATTSSSKCVWRHKLNLSAAGFTRLCKTVILSEAIRFSLTRIQSGSTLDSVSL
jgi:hypothetical protein